MPVVHDVRVARFIFLTLENTMKKSMLFLGALLCVGLGLLLGVLLFRGEQGKSTRPAGSESNATRTSDAKSARAPSRRKIESVPFGLQKPVRTREEMIQRIRELEQAQQTLLARNKSLDAELAALQGKRKAGLLSLKKKLEEMGAKGLTVFGDPSAVADLEAAIKALGAEGLNLVLDLLSSEKPGDRFFAAKLLEDLGDPASIPDLTRAVLEDKDEMTRSMASHALAFMRGEEALPDLKRIYKSDPPTGVRLNAMAGLVFHGDEQARQDMVSYLADPKNPSNLRQALAGVIAVRHDPFLMPVAREVERQFSQQPQWMGLVVSYYASVGTSSSRDRLQAIANNQSLAANIRQQAQQALNN